jgi:hypothetical protein
MPEEQVPFEPRLTRDGKPVMYNNAGQQLVDWATEIDGVHDRFDKLEAQLLQLSRELLRTKRKGKAHRFDVDADKATVVKDFMDKHCEMREGAGTPLEAMFKRFCEHYPGESISKVTLSRILVQSGCRRVAQGRYKQSVFLGVHMDP